MPLLSRERAMTTPKTFAQFHYFIVLSLLLPFLPSPSTPPSSPPHKTPFTLAYCSTVLRLKARPTLSKERVWGWCRKFISLTPPLSTLAFIFAKNAKRRENLWKIWKISNTNLISQNFWRESKKGKSFIDTQNIGNKLINWILIWLLRISYCSGRLIPPFMPPLLHVT